MAALPERKAKKNGPQIHLCAPVLDRVQYLGREFSNQRIRAVIHLDGRINAALLERAAGLTLDAEPVLGCRYVEGFWRPVWRRAASQPEICEIRTTVEGENADYLTVERDDAPHDYPVRIYLLRSVKDTIYVTMEHTCGDAAGLKDYLYLLASIYRHLSADPDYEPVPNIKGSRGLWQVYKQLDVSQLARVIKGALKKRDRTPGWSFPLDVPRRHEPFMICRQLNVDRFKYLREFAHKNQATVNDVVLAAYYRSLYRIIRPERNERLRIGVTFDLRRYLPSRKADAICNLFSTVWHGIDGDIGKSLTETVVIVRDNMNTIIRDMTALTALLPYVTLYNALPYAWHRSLSTRKTEDGRLFSLPPRLTNMGIIDADVLSFPGVEVTGAYLTGPVVFLPAFQFGVSTFKQVMTLSILSRGDEQTRQVVRQFLDRFESELPT